MKSLFLILFIVPILAYSQEDKKCEIKKEGIYVADIDSNTRIYINFFGKDSVVTTSSQMPIKDAMTYVSQEHQDIILSGKYKFKNCFVQIKAKGKMGKVQIEGIVVNDLLSLSVTNLNDNTYQEFIFKFYPTKE